MDLGLWNLESLETPLLANSSFSHMILDGLQRFQRLQPWFWKQIWASVYSCSSRTIHKSNQSHSPSSCLYFSVWMLIFLYVTERAKEAVWGKKMFPRNWDGHFQINLLCFVPSYGLFGVFLLVAVLVLFF